MTPGTGRLMRLLALAAASAIAVGLGWVTTAHAAEQPVQLSAKPVNQSGAYFDLTMLPGESRLLEIALGNNGSTPVTARTYIADAYTIVNGGFGAELRDGVASGTSTWVKYRAGVLVLAPQRAVTRSFTVSVPSDAPAGEYITSVVLENDDAVRGSGTLALDQVVRQVVAVAVRVPGPLRGSLAIGDAGHKHVDGRSVVAVDVINDGTMRLTPQANLVVHDSGGIEVSRATVRMDSFYAGTATKVEITLAETLREGAYTVDLALHDKARDVRAAAAELPFTVATPPVVADKQSGVRGAVAVIQDTIQEAGPARALIASLVVTALLLLAGGMLFRRAPRRRRGRSGNATPA